MSHPNEKTLLDAYAAFGRGDLDGFFKLCQPTITFAVPGDGLLSGRHTWAELLAALGTAMQAVGGSFKEEVLRLCANDPVGFVEVTQKVTRDGKTYSWKAVHVYQFTDGKMSSFTEYTDDQLAFQEAWRK